ncbi:MAG: high-affinity nickel-transport family protein, partial [Polyangiaceae bacterium]
GGAIILFGVVIPPRIGLAMEFAVAIMLVLLGTMNLSGLLKRAEPLPKSMRPLAIGLVHGLAGSAAAALLVLASVQDAGPQIAYLALFCVGTMAGMMLMTSALALPVVATANYFANLNRWIAQGTGVASVLFGLFMAYQVGIHDGLFSGHPVWSPH